MTYKMCGPARASSQLQLSEYLSGREDRLDANQWRLATDSRAA